MKSTMESWLERLLIAMNELPHGSREGDHAAAYLLVPMRRESIWRRRFQA